MRASDRLLLVACGAIGLAGPVMGIQEYALGTRATGLQELTGQAGADYGFRNTWYLILLVLTIVVGVLGSLLVLRVARSPRVRAVSRRLVALLVVGMVLLDLAYLLDHATAESSHLLRAVSVVWTYPVAAIVVALSTSRLVELEDAFAAPTAPLAKTA